MASALLGAAQMPPEDPAITVRRKAIIADIARTTHVSNAQAAAIENRLEKFIDRLEARLQYFIGDFPIAEKEERIAETIRDFFIGPKARVQVSSVTTNTTETYYVDEYLNNLAHLRRNRRYADVRLDFVKWDYNGMNRVADQPGRYEAAVSVWQLFVGSSDTVGYADETRKDLRLRLTLGPNDKVTFGIELISVAQTTSRRDLLPSNQR
jgi:hypothetical protein